MTEPSGDDTQPAITRERRRRLIRRSLVALAATGAVIALFLSGWFAHGKFQGDAKAPTDKLAETLFPRNGVTLNVRLGDLPARLVREGVIDADKFKAAAASAGPGLTPAELKVLSEGSPEPLRVDADNASFVLNVLWAVGLANRNPILTEGPIGQIGWEKAGSYASTAGWTLGTKPGATYLGTLDLIKLTPQQQAVVREVAFESYRPCCANMTAFPDCNHGMAALGLAELMASQGAAAKDISSALKKVSPFWFPTQYHHLALYFDRQGQAWDKVDPRVLMGKEYSSSTGWSQINAWLQQNGVFSDGTGGKASSCAS